MGLLPVLVMKGTSDANQNNTELLSIQIIFSGVLTSLETITSPVDRCQETILAHERQRILL